MTTFNETTDLSARLLATENLTVVRAAVQTASFDIKSRVLTLPMWKDMTPNIEDMLVAHEVGHALYTGTGYSDPIKENPKLKGYMNVLEDVRIEKLIKLKYPGLRRRMAEGYLELNERDFFKIKDRPLDQINLIDRINLYFKAGIKCGVQFTKEEMLFVKKAERTETIADVIELAKEVYAYAKEKAQEEAENALDNMLPEDLEDEMEDMEFEEGDGDFDSEEDDYDSIESEIDMPAVGDPRDDGEDYDPTTKPSRTDQLDVNPYEYEPPSREEQIEQMAEQAVESKTDEALAESLAEAADQDTEYNYHEFAEDRFNPVIGYKRVLEELNFDFGDKIASYYLRRVYGENSIDDYDAERTKAAKDFITQSQSAVNYMVKEFEMKKSADVYKRAQTSKSGSLDMKKIWGYKLNDDLFKRVTVVPEGKNHGMVFLLDWSGSMHSVIKDTIKQVINLAMFCKKVQIPFRVYAFTSSYRDTDEVRYAQRDFEQGLYDQAKEKGANYLMHHHFHLLEFFSDRMSNTEFNRMVHNLLDERLEWHTGYSLGGTPLNDALVWFYQNMDKFVKQNNVHKMNFITLTDGESQSLYSTGFDREWGWSDTANKRVKHNHFIKCPVTQKTYKWSNDNNTQTRTLINMIRDRWDVRIVGFFLLENKKRELEWACRSNQVDQSWNMIPKMRSGFRENGYFSMPNAPHDDLFIVPTNKTKIVEGELQANSEMTARKLASNLTKFVGAKKSNRVLLSRFIDLVA